MLSVFDIWVNLLTVKLKNWCEWHYLAVLTQCPATPWQSLLLVMVVVSCQNEYNPQIRMKDISLFFRGTFKGNKTKGRSTSILVKIPLLGDMVFPKAFAGDVQNHSPHTWSRCFTRVKRCLLRKYMEHWSVVPVKRISGSQNYLGKWSISPLLPFVLSAASVEHILFWSLWTCLSSEDHPQWEIVLSSMPLSTTHFRPGKVCVVVFGCNKQI